MSDWKAEAIAQATGRHVADLSALNDRHRFHGASQPKGEKASIALEMDVPFYVTLHRLLSQEALEREEVEVTGYTMELNAYPFGVQVLVRQGRDGTLKVFIRDDEGTSLVHKRKKES